MPIPRPDLSQRPLELTVERELAASRAVLYRAWTQDIGHWFATPESVVMKAKVDAPYFFETFFEGQRHAHYGRFLTLIENELVEITWSNAAGTLGHETIVRVEFEALASGTRIRLSHAGLPTEEIVRGHSEAWLEALKLLDDAYPIE